MGGLYIVCLKIRVRLKFRTVDILHRNLYVSAEFGMKSSLNFQLKVQNVSGKVKVIMK